MKRRALIAGNWKMHKSASEATQLAGQIVTKSRGVDDRDVLLAPPFTAVQAVAEALAGAPIIVAGQNVCWEEQGAYTGEISPLMLKELGATAAIVGHSERRQIFGETNALINQRLQGGLKFGLMMILCIGETLDERESGQTLAVLDQQIKSAFAGVSMPAVAQVVVAYEPVWAIGTGKTASTGQAQEAHAFIRDLVGQLYEKDIADNMRILYGGSVKPANVDELMAQSDIDGALVGGAALDAESFGRIINFKHG
ncbi:MAG: triose-phosphate isomerase [Desulfofustis sp.]|jgi:triosephosphate isomerase